MTLKKYQIGKRPAMMEYMDSGSRNSPPALKMNRCLQEVHVPECMTKGRSTLIQKDPRKGIVTNNYKPITCLPMMWKKLLAQIREAIYFSLKTVDCSLGNRKDAEKDPKAQENYSTLRINFFIYCRLFVLILVGFFLCCFFFTTFRPNFTSGLLQVINRDLR